MITKRDKQHNNGIPPILIRYSFEPIRIGLDP